MVSNIRKKNTSLEYLREAVKKELLPLLKSQGFLPIKSRSNDEYSKLSIQLDRKNVSTGYRDLLDIQFDRKNHPRFVLNLGKVPPEGVRSIAGFRASEEAEIVDLPISARLHPKKNSTNWFSMPILANFLNAESTATDVVQKAISLLPQANDWYLK